MATETSSKKPKPIALTEWAYETIKESILNLKAKPSSMLHIEKLATQLDISRTPVREALMRLQSDGLVRVVPRVGFFVTDMITSDLAELFEVREWLESNAIAKAATRLTDDDLNFLDELLESTARAIERNDHNQYLENEELFHGLFLERCGNKHLLDVMKSLDNMTRRERVLSVSSPENVRQSLAEHRRIVAAVQKGSPEESRKAMAEHIEAVRARVCAILADTLQKKGVNNE